MSKSKLMKGEETEVEEEEKVALKPKDEEEEEEIQGQDQQQGEEEEEEAEEAKAKSKRNSEARPATLNLSQEQANTNSSYDAELKSYQLKDDCKIPRLFLKLYFGGGAILYSLVTLYVLAGCLFSGISFAVAGFYYMLWITILMWVSTGLTIVSGKLGKKLFYTEERRERIFFVITGLLKILMDGLIFYGLIAALKDSGVDHYHAFFQFVGPLIYFALLYLVIVIEIFMAFLTICLLEDTCKFFAYMEIFCEFKKEFMLKYCTVDDV